MKPFLPHTDASSPSQCFTIVLVVSYKDIRFVERTISALRANVSECAPISLITDCRSIRENGPRLCNRFSLELIDEDVLLPGLTLERVKAVLAIRGRTNGAGWYFQQFLKMGFALSGRSLPYYLFWDADTIPLNPIGFFEGEQILFNPKKEHHQPYFDTISNLFGINRWPGFSFISEHFMVDRSIMAEMLGKIASSGNSSWWENILSAADLKENNSFSEMETFGNYCQVFHPGLYKARKLDSFRAAGKMFGRSVSDRELALLAYDFDTASFERKHHPNGIRGLRSRLRWAWTEFHHRICRPLSGKSKVQA